MDYYDFFGARIEIISQNSSNRKLLVRYRRDLIIIDEYCNYKNIFEERSRMRLSKEEIKKLNELV